jgi:hypothetical protein
MLSSRIQSQANAINSASQLVNLSNSPLRSTIANHLAYYPTPANLSYN